MSDEVIYLPFPRELYNDLIRLSDGRFDPASHIEAQIMSLVEFLAFDPYGTNPFEARLPELVAKHFEHRLKELEESSGEEGEYSPLIWKEVSLPAGTEVRMQYSGSNHFARVKSGRILDSGEYYTPSEWASKIASGTSRNAWRDLWFKKPSDKAWIPAELLRSQAKAQLTNGGVHNA